MQEAQLFAAPGRALRSRLIAVFLMLNWGIMGWFTIRSPGLGYAALTLTLGLIAFIGALSQLRAARNASESPLVRWNQDQFSFRPYTRNQFVEITWQRLHLNPSDKPSKGARPSADHVEVTITPDRIFFLGWPEPYLTDGEKPGVDDVAPRSILSLMMLTKSDQESVTNVLRKDVKS